LTLDVCTDVPYGNAGEVSVLEREGRTEVHFSADPHGGPECLWFCFGLKWHGQGPGSVPEGGPVALVLEHAGNMLGGNEPQYMRPVIRYGGTQAREDAPWQRLGEGLVARRPDGQVSVTWEIDPPPGGPGQSYADVAYCYPYGVPALKSLVQASEGYWRADSIGLSQGGRSLLRLSNDYGATGGVYCYLPDPAVHSRFRQEALSWTTAIKVALTPQYAAECFERVAHYASRWETPRCTEYCWSRHGVCGLGVETPYAMVGNLVLTREHYREVGARMAAGVVRKLGL
jgi:hypothetical protein